MSNACKGFALLIVLSASALRVHAQATVSLKAVSQNGIPVPPTSTIAVLPNDVIGVDIYISSWGNPPFDGATGLLREYRLTLAGEASARSSGYCLGLDGGGAILPYGWDAPIDKDECPCDNPDFPICDPEFGCVGPDHHPEWMAAIEGEQFGRIDAVFHPLPYTCALETTSFDIRFGCQLVNPGGQSAKKCIGGSASGLSCTTNANCPGSTCSAAFQHYAGTLYLIAGSDVCGTYTYTLQSGIEQTFLSNSASFPIKALPIIQPLTLFVPRVCSNPTGGCCTEDLFEPSCEIACEEDCRDANQWFGGVGSTCATLNPPCTDSCVTRAGACCDENEGSCTDDVCGEDCAGANHRFGGIGSKCNDIDPPCERINFPFWMSSPPNCVIDARIPYKPGQPSERLGYSQLTLPFQYSIGSGEDSPNDFEINQIPAIAPPIPPSIVHVQVSGGNIVILHFSDPIQPNKWTCVRHLASNTRYCLGFLPADANSNRTASPADILDLIDSLNGLRNPPLAQHQCDIDRSGVCAPADILTEIDLLNGASGFPVQNGDTLPACPSQD